MGRISREGRRVANKENPDPRELLRAYLAELTAACDTADEALKKLDPVAERKSKGRIVELCLNIHAALERLDAHFPDDRKIKAVLERFDKLPQPLTVVDARRMIGRLEEVTIS